MQKLDRNKEIYERFYSPPVFDDNGRQIKVTLKSLGKDYGISAERIRQILLKEARRRTEELKNKHE